MSELVGDGRRRPSVALEEGGRGLAEDVAGDPEKAAPEPCRLVRTSDKTTTTECDAICRRYLDLYPAARKIVHALAARANRPTQEESPCPFTASRRVQPGCWQDRRPST